MPTPLRNLSEVEVTGLLDLERYMSGEIIGQHRAISSLVRAFNIGGAGLLPDNSTIANLFFSGPTGVGKTETARALARFLKTRELADGVKYPDLPLVKIDSGTVSRFGTSNLIGSSIGVVGSRGDREGATEPLLACSRFPENRIMVVLWDEIEKALLGEYSYGGADELLSVLLPALDDGELLTRWDLSSRKSTNLRKSIHIFTSNIGAKKIEEEGGKKIGFDVRSSKSGNHLNEEEVAELNERIYQLVKEEYNYFPPEFRSRITRHVVYRFHSRPDFVGILEKEIRQFRESSRKINGMNVELSDDAKAWLVDFGVVREAGARSLQRAFHRKIVDPIAAYVNAEEIGSGDDIMVRVDNPEDEDTKFLFFKHD